MKISLIPALAAIFLSISQNSSAAFVLNVNPFTKQYYLSGQGGPVFSAVFAPPVVVTWDNSQPRVTGEGSTMIYGNDAFSVPPQNPTNLAGIFLFIYNSGNVNGIIQIFGPVNATLTADETVINSYQSWSSTTAALFEQKAAAGELIPTTLGGSAFDITFRLVPEPSAAGLLAASVIGLAASRKRK